MSVKKRTIVTIGGGTGSFMVLSALKDYPVRLVAIVSMADDGGSTGKLRDQYGVLPPGDVRRALVALSDSSKELRDLFNFRFQKGGLDGHSFGNLFLAALEKITNDFGSAVDEAARILNTKGEVIPVTLDDIRLYARLTDGTVLKGETTIDIPYSLMRLPIEKVWIKPKARLNPRARMALIKADMIVIGPGDIYTSLIPNLLVSGMPQVIEKSKAKKVFVANLMTKYGETHGFGARDFVDEIEKYLGRGVLDFAIFNSKKPSVSILKRYRQTKAEFVDPSGLDLKRKKPKYILADLINRGVFIRHGPRQKLAKVLLSLL